MYALEGRRAIITGGGGGIGRAVALRLAGEGCDVGLVDLDEAGARATAEEIRGMGRRAFAAAGNVGERESIGPALDGLMDDLGGVEILVNNAGILRLGSLVEMDEKDWSDTFRVNVDGLFWTTRRVLPRMLEAGRGSIVNMASWMGKKGVANYAAYCGSKFAVIGITQSLAFEVAAKGIRVNAVCPGIIVDTAMRRASDEVSRAKGLPIAAERTHTIPTGRLGLPEDVARVVTFLASDEADYMTGQAVNITGGLWTN